MHILTNQSTSFGNDMLSKYAGMVTAINPLSLFYLKNETQEEAPALQQAPSITYVQNQIHKVNHHHYHTMANRYMINYQNTMNLIASNPMISQQELADSLNITRSSVAVHISNLL